MIKLVDISQKWVLIVCGVFFLLSAVCFALRLYATRRKFSRIFADDWMMLVSLVGLLLLTVGTYTAVLIGGMGLNKGYVMNCYGKGPVEFLLLNKFITTSIWTISASACHISILLFYRRAFPVQRMRLLTKYGSVLVLLFTIASLFKDFLICIPIQEAWSLDPQPGSCGNMSLGYGLSLLLNLTLQTAILLLPQPTIWTLQMAPQPKIGLSILFLVGLCGVAMGSVRAFWLLRGDTQNQNTTRVLALSHAWTTIEPALNISLACVPAIRTLFAAAPGAPSGNRLPVYREPVPLAASEEILLETLAPREENESVQSFAEFLGEADGALTPSVATVESGDMVRGV